MTPGQRVHRAIRQMPQPPSPRYTEEELREIIAETEAPAIGLARVYPPTPTCSATATSFMGGLPRLPDDVDWPVSPSSNRPRTFLAQLDCSALPRCQSHPWLPESGTIWIFAGPDISTYFAQRIVDSEGSHVIYRDIDASTLAERQPPDGPPWWDGAWGETKSYPHFGAKKLDESKGFCPTVLTPWALEFALLKSYQDDWNHEVSISENDDTAKPDLSALSDLPRLKRITFTGGEWEPLRRSHAKLLQKSLLDAFGLNETRYNLWHRSRPWHGRAEGPLTWLALRRFCFMMRRTLRQQLDRAETTPEMAKGARRAITIFAVWLAKADKYPAMSVMPTDRRDAFLQEIQSLENADGKLGDLSQVILGKRLNDSIHDVLKYQIWHPDCGSAGFDPEVIACESWRHRPFTRIHEFGRDNLDGPPDGFTYLTIFHRLLGAQTTEYYGGPGPEGHIVLAEFNGDLGLDLTIGDGSGLIFWIRPQDLAARDFSKVLVTPGAGTVDFDQDRFRIDEEGT